jgi:hypothetical protein
VVDSHQQTRATAGYATRCRILVTLIKVLDKRPSHCRELVVVDDPDYIGYCCNASKLGAGAVGMALLGHVHATPPPHHPIVWRVECWPKDIRNNVVSLDNPQNGTITNSNLEMASETCPRRRLLAGVSHQQ